jgi:GNAT superfamily N-acetyltransferase
VDVTFPAGARVAFETKQRDEVICQQLGDEVSSSPGVTIRRLRSIDDAQIEALAGVLIDCIDGGAGVSFLHPLAPEKATRFWRGVAADVTAGKRALLVAEDEKGVVGTVQLVLDQPENQPHRADLAKMLVHRRARRQGLGAALLRAAEDMARDCGKSLLVLDTNEGSEAERLYARMGWVCVGTIPNYSVQPRGGLRGTTLFYKSL